MTHQERIDVGSIVQIGPAAPLDRKMTWRVTHIDQAAEGVFYARLVSGASGQHRTHPLNDLSLFRLKETA